MLIRPSSPSAHFYATRGGSFITHQKAPGMDASLNYVEPFKHFTGFPPHGADQQPMHQDGLLDPQVPEELISPRMPIPNPAVLRGLPLPQAHGLVGNNGDIQVMHRHTFNQHDAVASFPCDLRHSRPTTDRCSPNHHRSLPPLFTGNYRQNSITGLPPPRPFYSAHQKGSGCPSAQPHNNNNNSGTIRVPSVSDLSSVSAYDNHTIGLSDHNDDSGHLQGINHLALDPDGDGAPMVFPRGGASSDRSQDGHSDGCDPLNTPTMSTNSSVSMVRRDLANDVVEVHDICLLATQRYLDALRVNWSLRHGREEAVVVLGRGRFLGQRIASGKISKKNKNKGRIITSHDGDECRGTPQQGFPYPRRQRRRRSIGNNSSSSGRRRHALSENGDLEGSEAPLGHFNVGAFSSPLYHCPRFSSHDSGSDDHHHYSARPRGSDDDDDDDDNNNNNNPPIPKPTNSLLQNIHHICELIWRRARRDRMDVLGAEAKGCRDMEDLQDRGETIVLYNAVDAERDPEGCFARVLEAGRGICRSLNDWEALRAMEDWDALGDRVDV